MPIRSVLKKNTYQDSVALMDVSSTLTKIDGVLQAAAMMATEANLKLLADAGLLTDEAKKARPNDLFISIEAEDEKTFAIAFDHVEKYLNNEIVKATEKKEESIQTIAEAIQHNPDANIVLISTPGQYAATEAYKALQEGLHVFMFSDNVSVADEIMLKEIAVERGLLMMGPDCGTAIINGNPLGFANVVRKGPIGIVAASGTGLQEVSSLIHRLGSGVSQAIGVGSHDLSVDVGGLMMNLALDALVEDPQTKVIVLISKPPAPSIAEKLLKKIKKISKPVVVNFLGGDLRVIHQYGAIPAFTLEDAGAISVAVTKKEEIEPLFFSQTKEAINEIIQKETSKMNDRQRWIRGLYSGGTFCSEAQLLLRDMTGKTYSNVPIQPDLKLNFKDSSREHTVLDLGDDAYTVGRPHPMIDFRMRAEAIIREAQDVETAVILLDVVLGFGAHENPAAELVPAILEAKEIAKKNGNHISFIASICGTDEDFQNRQLQYQELEKTGVLIMDSNAQAVRLSGLIASRQFV